ncbi:MAG: hypothetical protein AAGG75_27365 [Bacteroidota bacterium]
MNTPSQSPKYPAYFEAAPPDEAYLDSLLHWYQEHAGQGIREFINEQLMQHQQQPLAKDELICRVIGMTRLRGKKATQNIYEDTASHMEIVQRQATADDQSMEQFELADRMQLLKKWMNSYLSPKEYYIIKMRLEGHPYKTIASTMGDSSEVAIRKAYSRALTKIKALSSTLDF